MAAGTDHILLTLPESFESERLLIRAPLWGDGKAVNEAVCDSIEELRPWMPWAQSVPSVDESEANIRHARLEFLSRRDLRLLIFLKESGEFVGSSGLHRIDWQVRKFEIGYWARTPFAGKGYVTEAVEAITNYAITELRANRIFIRCDSRNTRSRNVAERSGYTFEGKFRNDACDVNGELRDTLVFSKVRGVEFE
ncbi:GNAT family N-acetyltransferase [Paenibacillus pinihumi]|uniref:GNAT family N-acetyltransferase n=1 Tax=Paenibacillus pinihumi TaxID=669462 RepID=UPI00048C607D|nr:GNAT family N-acetyltransferase [Paenibacillus pinihumi]